MNKIIKHLINLFGVDRDEYISNLMRVQSRNTTFVFDIFWHFTISEDSANCYSASADKEGRKSVQMTLSDSDLYRLLGACCEEDVASGNSKSDAVFEVVRSWCASWKSQYAEKAFGSWIVKARTGYPAVTFDGKDQIISIDINETRRIYEARIAQFDYNCFRSIISLYHQSCI